MHSRRTPSPTIPVDPVIMALILGDIVKLIRFRSKVPISKQVIKLFHHLSDFSQGAWSVDEVNTCKDKQYGYKHCGCQVLII